MSNNTIAYTVKVSAPEEREKIMEFLYKHYADMPLFSAFADGRPPYSPPTKGDFTVKAVTDSGQIIGVAVNAVKTIFSDDGKSGDKWFEVCRKIYVYFTKYVRFIFEKISHEFDKHTHSLALVYITEEGTGCLF